MAGSRIQRNLARLGRQAGRAVDWASRHRRRAQEAHGLVLMYHRVASGTELCIARILEGTAIRPAVNP